MKRNPLTPLLLNGLTIDIHLYKLVVFVSIFFAISLTIESLLQTLEIEASPTGSRTHYVYDRAGIIHEHYENLLDNYLRRLDDSTTAEVIVYTISSFVGHGIVKNGQEIQDRDSLSNYIFNELYLDGIKGIGKGGKDNGILLLFSSNPVAAGGSTRIEVGRGHEGNRITVARTYYNDGVRDYNTFLKVFPNTIFNNNGVIGLKPWGFTDLPQFQANSLVKTTIPQVNLTLQ